MSVEWWSVKGAFPFFLSLTHLEHISKRAGGLKLKLWQSTHVEVTVANSSNRNLFLVSLAKHKLPSDSSNVLLQSFGR